jgi:hypothetical protein
LGVVQQYHSALAALAETIYFLEMLGFFLKIPLFVKEN